MKKCLLCGRENADPRAWDARSSICPDCEDRQYDEPRTTPMSDPVSIPLPEEVRNRVVMLIADRDGDAAQALSDWAERKKPKKVKGPVQLADDIIAAIGPALTRVEAENGRLALVPRDPGTCMNDDSGWLLEFMRALHGNVPEGEQPTAWMDFSDPQRERIQAAWRALIAALSPPETPKT